MGVAFSETRIDMINSNQDFNEDDFISSWDLLKKRIMVLSSQWENRINWNLVERWLDNFNGATGHKNDIENYMRSICYHNLCILGVKKYELYIEIYFFYH